jgi:56kDa selenium binding protein (SBP56)
VAAFDPTSQQKDALAVVDCDPDTTTFGGVVGWTELSASGNELHHFGWHACSSALCHEGNGHHEALERRYLLVPGLPSSTTYVLDTKPDPRHPVVTHTIEASEYPAKAGYSRPHTVHCGPDGIFMSALGGINGAEGPGGIALIDHDTFEGHRIVGSRPRTAILGVRRLVAPEVRDRDHLGVGDTLDRHRAVTGVRDVNASAVTAYNHSSGCAADGNTGHDSVGSGGGSDLALGQNARCDLVEQRLEQVVLGPGDHRDIDGRVLERLGRDQPAETRTDDDDRGYGGLRLFFRS